MRPPNPPGLLFLPCCLVIVCTLHPGTLRAQPVFRRADADPRWAVVPASSSEPAEIARARRAAELLVERMGAQGQRVGSLEAQTEVFREVHSYEPRKVTRDELDHFLMRAERVREAYAFERRAGALRQMDEALQWGRKARASILRDNRVASRFLDTCLMKARHELEANRDERAAKRLIRGCLLEAIDVPYTDGEHPPEVEALIADVQKELETSPTSKLVLRSTPAGCDVYVNGRFIAKTDTDLERPLRGQYPIQVECPGYAGRGRVHVREIGHEVVTLHVDAAFEDALRTLDDDVLRLQLHDAQQRDRHAGDYALRVGKVLSAQYAVLVTVPDPAGPARVQLLRGPQPWPETSFSLSAAGEAGHDLDDAVRALVSAASVPERDLCTDAVMRLATIEGDAAARVLAARCPDDPGWRRPTVPAYPPTVVALFGSVGGAATDGDAAMGALPGGDDPLDDRAGAGGLHPAIGITGLSLGLAAYVGGGVAFAFADDDGGRALGIATTAVGGGLALSGFTLLTRDDAQPGVPWWGWTLGGVGAAAVAYGGYFLAIDGKCTNQTCGEVADTAHYGALMVASGAPLLLLPLSQLLFHPQPGERAGLSLQLARGGAMLSYGGTL